MMKKVPTAKLIEALQEKSFQRQQEEVTRKKHHTPITYCDLRSSGNMDLGYYQKQLAAYREDAKKLDSDAAKVEFWLQKARKNDVRICSHIMPFVHNMLLEKRGYLREAIALGSVAAALAQDQLIQTAVAKKDYHLLGSNFDLEEPNVAASLRISPMLQLYFNGNVTEQEKADLNQAMIEAFPVQPADRAAVMGLILREESDTAKRNKIATYVLKLPIPAQKVTIINTQGKHTASSNSSSSHSNHNNNAESSSSSSSCQHNLSPSV